MVGVLAGQMWSVAWQGRCGLWLGRAHVVCGLAEQMWSVAWQGRGDLCLQVR